MMASATEEQPVTGTPARRSLVDLPSETIALIFENTTDHDLANLCRVSKKVREIAAAELYRILNHTFNEESTSNKYSIDYLAGYLETLATSDYNYAAHVKEVYVDTGYTAGRGEQASRQFFYDLTCGKFFNTLLLAVLKRTRSLEGFCWNVRIELSTAVFQELHRMPNLRRLHIRLQAGQSLHVIPKTGAGVNQSVASTNASPISPGAPPGTHSPSGAGWAFPSSAPPSTTLRMVAKLPATKPVSQPRSFSGFKNLKYLCAAEMDSLDYIPELAESIRNSLDTLKQLELSLSDALARRAREKPRVDASDGASTDDASTVASENPHVGDESAPSGATPEQTRQWHRSRQEVILSKIFATATTDAKVKEAEAASNEIVFQAEDETQTDPNRDNSHLARDDEDKMFVKMMRAIFHEARSKQELSSKGAKAMDKIEKAATKYLEGRPKSRDDTKAKPASKSSLIKIKLPKLPPPPGTNVFPGLVAPNSSYKSYSVHENVLIDHLGFSKGAWDQMNTLTKNHWVQSYFKETQGMNFQPYPMLAQHPPPSGKSTTNSQVYYAYPSSIPNYTGAPKYVVIPPKKSKPAHPPKPKYASDSDDPAKASKSAQASGGESSLPPDPASTPVAKGEKDDLSEDPEMLFPSENEEESPDQQFETEDEASGEEGNGPDPDMEELQEGINSAILESGWLEGGEESPVVTGKGKQVVRDPPNGHLTPPKPQSEGAIAPPEARGDKGDEENAVSKYIRLSHGISIEKLAIYLVPVKAATFLHHFDMYALKNLTLLNVGSQRRIWAALTKLQNQSPLPLKAIYTDNVTPSLMTFLESLVPGQLEELFLLERYLRKKGRVPQLQDCDTTTVGINEIRKHVMRRHMAGLKKLMIRNDDTEDWAMNTGTVHSIGREGAKLRELAIQCDTVTFHRVVRSLPYLRELYALHITFILDPNTPPLSMTGPTMSNSHHHYDGVGMGSIEPQTPASATMLDELRQCVVDAVTFCKDTTQLEYLGFSWLTSSRGATFLDADGNPYVFLSRIVRDSEREGGDSECGEDGDDDDDDGVRKPSEAQKLGQPGSSKSADATSGGVQPSTEPDQDKPTTATTTKATTAARDIDPFSIWAENDLNISEVQDIRMWDKEIWAGRL